MCNCTFAMGKAGIMYHFGEPFQAYLLGTLFMEGEKNIKPLKI